MPMPNAGTTPPMRGVPLDDCWKIGDQFPTHTQRHATVYRVLDKAGLLVENLEAHVFVLDDTEPGIRDHRLRCIKRMTNRTKLKVRVRNVAIVVISSSPASSNSTGKKTETISGPVVISNDPQSPENVEGKTPSKQDSARIRQKERRQAKRALKAKKHVKTAASEQDEAKTKTSNGTETQIETEASEQDDAETAKVDDRKTDYMTLPSLIWILYTKEGFLKSRFPIYHYKRAKDISSDSLYERLREYLELFADIELEPPAHLEFQRTAIEKSKISLESQLIKLLDATEYFQENLDTLQREQAQHETSSTEWKQAESGAEENAILRREIIAYAHVVLPRVLEEQESVIQYIKQRETHASSRLAFTEAIDQSERRVRNMARYDAWTHTASRWYHHADLLRQLEEAETVLTESDYEPAYGISPVSYDVIGMTGEVM